MVKSAIADHAWRGSFDTAQKRVGETKRVVGSRVRVKVMPPPGAPAAIAEISIIDAM